MGDKTTLPNELVASSEQALLKQPIASAVELPYPDLRELSISNRDARTWDTDPRPGERDFEWFQKNLLLLAPAHAGMWVSIVKEKVTGSAPTFLEAYKKAEAQGNSSAFIGYVPDADDQNRTLIL